MSSKAAKLAPIVAVGGAMGYFCWSHLDESAAPPPPAKAAAAKAELTAALLSPPPAPDLVRNPFEAHRKVVAHEPAAGQGKPGGPAQPAKPHQAKPVREQAVLASQHNSALAAGLVLNGTYASGKRRIAIINGSLYAEGDSIAVGNGATAAISVARVDADKVVLSSPGATAEVSYLTPVQRDVSDNKQIRIAASPAAVLPDAQPAQASPETSAAESPAATDDTSPVEQAETTESLTPGPDPATDANRPEEKAE